MNLISTHGVNNDYPLSTARVMAPAAPTVSLLPGFSNLKRREVVLRSSDGTHDDSFKMSIQILVRTLLTCVNQFVEPHHEVDVWAHGEGAANLMGGPISDRRDLVSFLPWDLDQLWNNNSNNEKLIRSLSVQLGVDKCL